MDLQRCTFFLDQGPLQQELIDRSVGLAEWLEDMYTSTARTSTHSRARVQSDRFRYTAVSEASTDPMIEVMQEVAEVPCRSSGSPLPRVHGLVVNAWLLLQTHIAQPQPLLPPPKPQSCSPRLWRALDVISMQQQNEFTCQHTGCGASFARQDNLSRHLESHLADRPYKCTLCLAAFSRK